jgi:hypothetical protein
MVLEALAGQATWSKGPFFCQPPSAHVCFGLVYFWLAKCFGNNFLAVCTVLCVFLVCF